jgi:hypothetical protein
MNFRGDGFCRKLVAALTIFVSKAGWIRLACARLPFET